MGSPRKPWQQSLIHLGLGMQAHSPISCSPQPVVIFTRHDTTLHRFTASRPRIRSRGAKRFVFSLKGCVGIRRSLHGEACRAELTLASSDLRDLSIQVAEIGGLIVGVVQVSMSGATASLEKLFVSPDAMRSGAGRRLFEWSVETARERGARTLVIDSAPRRCGFLSPHGRA